MGYLFVDRILEIERSAGGSFGGRGLKAVRPDDPFLRPGPGGALELSLCFAGEAVGQLAAWLAMSSSGFTRRPVAGLTSEAELLGTVKPGDLLELRVEIESLDEEAVHYHGEASVRGSPVLRLHHTVGPMLPLLGFDDPRAVERRFQALRSPGPASSLVSSPPEGVSEGASEGGSGAVPVFSIFKDGILEREPDRILAVTEIQASAPYLADHFPRDPVLPATLLFDGQIVLALMLMDGAPGTARVERLRDLKMRDFVRPGSRLHSEVRIRERRGEGATAQLTGRIGDRVVSRGLADMRVKER